MENLYLRSATQFDHHVLFKILIGIKWHNVYHTKAEMKRKRLEEQEGSGGELMLELV